MPWALAALILSWAYLPYFQVSQTFHYTRTIRDAAHFSHSINRLWQPDILIIIGLLLVLGWGSQQSTKPGISLPNFVSAKTLWIIILTGTIFMLGPVLKVDDQTFKIFNLPIPLPYAAAYYGLPMLRGFRAVSRWIEVVNVGAALLVGYYLTRSRLTWLSQITLVGLLLCIYWGTQVRQLQLFPIPTELPTAYGLLNTTTSSTTIIAEFPVMSWGMAPYAGWENDRLLFQTYHQRPIFNGASGFIPPEREAAITQLWREFPNDAAIEYLHQQQVQAILVHFDQYQLLDQAKYQYADVAVSSVAELKNQLTQQSALVPAGCTPDACLYTIYANGN